MTPPSTAGDPWRDLLNHMDDYLRLCRESGIESMPAAPTVQQRLAVLAREVAACTQCPLCRSRTMTVPGQGSPNTELLFVGEGPGAEEDRQGLAFVGAAGQLLTRMIKAMGYTRDEVFIANVVKCRPPDNRTPLPEEANACLPYLQSQIELLQPSVIVTLGATPLKALLRDPMASVTRMRGIWTSYQDIDLMPTFHPAYVLRKPESKPLVWDDLKQVMARLGRPPPT